MTPGLGVWGLLTHGGEAGRCLCWGGTAAVDFRVQVLGWECQITSGGEPRDPASEGQVDSAVPHTPRVSTASLPFGQHPVGPLRGGQDAGFVPGGKAPGPGWGRGQRGWREGCSGDLACCPGLRLRCACLLLRDQPAGAQLHTAAFVGENGLLAPAPATGQAATVPGHLSRGNALVPGSLWVAGPQPRRVLAGRGHCLKA